MDVPPARELLAHDDGVLGRRGEVRALDVALADRLADGGVRVALDHGPEAVVEVVHLVAVDVPDARTVAVLEVDRPGGAGLGGGRDPAAQHAVRAFVHRVRTRRALVEARLLALGELLDALTVDAGGGGSHGASLGARRWGVRPNAARATRRSGARRRPRPLVQPPWAGGEGTCECWSVS